MGFTLLIIEYCCINKANKPPPIKEEVLFRPVLHPQSIDRNDP